MKLSDTWAQDLFKTATIDKEAIKAQIKELVDKL